MWPKESAKKIGMKKKIKVTNHCHGVFAASALEKGC
jgi:hypothetical protein